MAIATKITPKNFLTTAIPEGPNNFSKKPRERKQIYTIIRFTRIPIRIL